VLTDGRLLAHFATVTIHVTFGKSIFGSIPAILTFLEGAGDEARTRDFLLGKNHGSRGNCNAFESHIVTPLDELKG
jgi:hypothetical protein